MNHGAAGRLLGILLLVLISSCSGLGTAHPSPTTPGGPNASRLPARPRDIPINGLDPCTALTPPQRQQLGVGRGKASSLETSGSPVCQWIRFPEEPQDAYLITTDTRRSAEYALNSLTGARIVDVAGYAAVETQVGSSPPTTECVLLVDIAPDQNLWVQYDYGGKTVPMTKQLACEKAHTAAEMAVATLTQQTGGS